MTSSGVLTDREVEVEEENDISDEQWCVLTDREVEEEEENDISDEQWCVLTDREVEVEEENDISDEQWRVFHKVVDILKVVVDHVWVCTVVGHRTERVGFP